LWSSVRGTNHRIQAERTYFRTVSVTNEESCFNCTRSYLDSLTSPAKGYNPENFLEEQAKDEFRATWPKARDSPTSRERCFTSDVAEVFGKRMVSHGERSRSGEGNRQTRDAEIFSS